MSDTLYDPGLFEQAFLPFRTRQRVMAWMVMGDGVLFTILAILSAVAFFGAEDTRDQILYAACFVACVVIIALVKMWYWALVHRTVLLRVMQSKP